MACATLFGTSTNYVTLLGYSTFYETLYSTSISYSTAYSTSFYVSLYPLGTRARKRMVLFDGEVEPGARLQVRHN